MKKWLVVLMFASASLLAFGQEYTMLGEEVKHLDGGVPICVDGNTWRYRIELVEVLDATHFKVRTKGNMVEMSLHAVDSPRIGQRFGEEAKEWTEGYLKDHAYEFVLDGDPDGQLRCSGLFVNELVAAGWAWIPPSVLRDHPSHGSATFYSLLEEDQNDARREMLGVWSDVDPTPPWKRYK